eukprot:TRINITY_DN9380_c1_g1_i1.p1 TRINITY_DN9380_c1_g1~~TRINITY_DN9380_c1_g1_i1.p1  ORF type:complete len:145 (-),score=13.18 TRINITY_DN9380_c1_g1_i1:336-770(-)
MLSSKSSDVLSFGRTMEVMDNKRRVPSYTISKSERFPEHRGLKTYNLPPGKYRLDCEFVNDARKHIQGSRITRSHTSPKFSFGRSIERCDSSEKGGGFLRGIAPTFGRDVNLLGPGHYDAPGPGNTVSTSRAPCYTVPKARSTR